MLPVAVVVGVAAVKPANEENMDGLLGVVVLVDVVVVLLVMMDAAVVVITVGAREN